jgi:pyrroloquinoline quinone (PQQ) biosynthesis protein C
MSVVLATGSEPNPAWAGADGDPARRFLDSVMMIAARHQPSQKPLFRRLAALPRPAAHNPAMLGQIYLIYQAAMHATRAAVYFMPHLDSPALRKRKLQIYVDDDGLPGGDTHHYQLARAFRSIGAEMPLGDEEFGDAEELCAHLDADTARFVRLAKSLYSRSLGPWCIVETLSDDWMRALAEALAVHHPHFPAEPYFAECFAQGVEERHAAEALEVTQLVLRQRPHLLKQTLQDAEAMAEALDAVWDRLDAVVRQVA